MRSSDLSDLALQYVMENSGTLLSEAHDFLTDLHSGWVFDPEGNPIQLVWRKKPAAADISDSG